MAAADSGDAGGKKPAPFLHPPPPFKAINGIVLNRAGVEEEGERLAITTAPTGHTTRAHGPCAQAR